MNNWCDVLLRMLSEKIYQMYNTIWYVAYLRILVLLLINMVCMVCANQHTQQHNLCQALYTSRTTGLSSHIRTSPIDEMMVPIL